MATNKQTKTQQHILKHVCFYLWPLPHSASLTKAPLNSQVMHSKTSGEQQAEGGSFCVISEMTVMCWERQPKWSRNWSHWAHSTENVCITVTLLPPPDQLLHLNHSRVAICPLFPRYTLFFTGYVKWESS